MLVPLAIFLVSLLLRSLRWQLIFSPGTRPAFLNCLTALGIGNMANFLLPGRAGDVARCVLLSGARSLTGNTRILGTLAVEKVLDGLALVAVFFFSVSAMHLPHWVAGLLQLAVVIFGGALVGIVVLRYRMQTLLSYIRFALRAVRLSSIEDRFVILLSSFVDGLSAVSSSNQILSLVFMTGTIWLTEAALVWSLAFAMGLALPIRPAILATATLGLGLMIPVAPGGLGTYELFGTEAFKFAGIALSSALALTLVIHAWVFVTNMAMGSALLGVRGIRLAQFGSPLEVATASPIPDLNHATEKVAS